MKLKFVYWFYAPKTEFPLIYKYHFACLRKYVDLFDDIVICLAVDDIKDYSYINYLETLFISLLGVGKNLSFKIYKNNPFLREAEGFKTEIIDKLHSTKELVFFGHSKGFTNIFSNSLKYWIASMYYFNLYSTELVKMYMQKELVFFYGGIVVKGEQMVNKYKWHFPGSFYWLNCPYLGQEFDTVPILENRAYAEMFPGMLTDIKAENGVIQRVASLGRYFLEGVYNFYTSCRANLSLAYSEEMMKDLDEFVIDLDEEVKSLSF